MTLSLRSRLFVAHLAVVSTALALVIVLAAREQRAWVLRQNVEQLTRESGHAVRWVSEQSGGGGPGNWQAWAMQLAAERGLRFTLIDSTGRVLGDSEVAPERLAGVENHAARQEVRAALGGSPGHALRHSATIGLDLLYVAVPAHGAPGLAVLRVAEPQAELARLTASLLRLLIVAAALTLGLSMVLVFWITGGHAARIRELSEASQRLGEGSPTARARELPADEVGRLGQAINRMAGELRSRVVALERERDEREEILSHMSDGVVLVDDSGHVVHANLSLASILGAPLPPPAGTPFQAFARSPELEELLREALAAGQTVERELKLWTPRQRLVRATATRLGGETSGGVVLVLHDMTEAERLNRVRQDFVANVSHELKTPLTSVRGYAETLLEGGLEDREHREGFVRVIRDQAERLQALVEDLLSLAELERPGARLRLESFDLRAAVERQLADFRDRARQAGLKLDLAPGASIPVSADRGRIEQVIANLLDNAVKYTERGEVEITVGADQHRAWCEVRDTGPGIPEADQPRIFERFYRLDKARSREKGGTGLGLSIVKHIVGLHGGQVTVASTPGQGSTFRFELPRPSSATAAAAT